MQNDLPQNLIDGNESSSLKDVPLSWAALLAGLRERTSPVALTESAPPNAELIHPFTRLLLKRPPTLAVTDPKAARTIENGSVTPPFPATPAPSGAPLPFHLLML